jgi:hypothetical protein
VSKRKKREPNIWGAASTMHHCIMQTGRETRKNGQQEWLANQKPKPEKERQGVRKTRARARATEIEPESKSYKKRVRGSRQRVKPKKRKGKREHERARKRRHLSQNLLLRGGYQFTTPTPK